MGLIPDTFNMKLVNNLKVRIQNFPNTARLVGILICIISCCCGIACGLMAMAIAWVYYRTSRWLEARISEIFVDVFGFNSSISLRGYMVILSNLLWCVVHLSFSPWYPVALSFAYPAVAQGHWLASLSSSSPRWSLLVWDILCTQEGIPARCPVHLTERSAQNWQLLSHQHWHLGFAPAITSKCTNVNGGFSSRATCWHSAQSFCCQKKSRDEKFFSWR